MGLAAYPQELGNPGNWLQVDAVDRVARLGDLMEEAETRNVFDGLPTGSQSTREDCYLLRGQVIAERLWLLGYLDADSKQAASQSFKRARKTRFIPAVKAFQSDMGLRVDEWPGPITWQTLAQLVSFENDRLEPDWVQNPAAFPALLRAAQCRLCVLGLAANLPARNFTQVSPAAVTRFHQLVFALHALDDREAELKLLTSGKLTRQSLMLLLDQDRLIVTLSQAWSLRKTPGATRGQKYFRFFYSQAMGDLSRAALKALVNRFIYRITLVEFWLLGYDVDLGNRSNIEFPVRGWGTGQPGGREDESLRHCLEDFAWRTGSSVHNWRKAIVPELFIELAAVPDPENSELDKALQSHFCSEQEITSALSDARRQGPLRLWDGMKRIARWLAKIAGKARTSLKDWTTSLARFFYHRSLEAYDAVKYAVSLVVNSLSNLDGYRIREPDFIVLVNPDGDHGVCISPGTNNQRSLRLVRRLRLESARFALAAQLVGFFLGALTSSLLSRWAALARTLYDNAKRCIELVQQIYALEKSLAANS